MIDRRTVLKGAAAGGAALLLPRLARAAMASDLAPVRAQIDRQREPALQRLQHWIRQPSVSAENIGVRQCCDMTMGLLREAGFGHVERVETDGHPGIFATHDAGAKRTLGVYFMYDVKGVDPKEWSSPPWAAALVDKPGIGKVLMGRGAVNQKGPESAFLAALHAIRGAGRKLPVNLVLVAEGEEELGSPHFAQVVRRPEVAAALKRCQGMLLPSAEQDLDGTVKFSLGAKGIVEFELEASGERWGRGATHDVHSSQKARVDSPVWHLVQALGTLVTADGADPAIEGLDAAVRPPTAAERAMLDDAAKRLSEATDKKVMGVQHWAKDTDFRGSLERLAMRPTVNIQGLNAGYTGPGGKTVMPHRALAKLEVRLVPDMKPEEVLPAIRAHLQKRGFGDVEVRPLDGNGYPPNTTARAAQVVGAAIGVYRKAGIDPVVLPRSGGSWPGYLFTDKPLGIPAVHFGLGYGQGAHAPDEFYIIESARPQVQGFAGATRSFVDFLYGYAAA